MKIKPFLMALCCLFLTASYTVEPNAYEVAGTPSYPKISAWWQFSPQVVVCERSKLKESKVKSAISYWEKLGYKFEPIMFVKDHNLSCLNGPAFGEIVIDMPSQEFDFTNLGQTKTSRSIELSLIIRAKIEIQNMGLEKERVLEHEIGHALGWEHTRRSYHMMHPAWQRGGWDSAGLRHNRYLELSEEFINH